MARGEARAGSCWCRDHDPAADLAAAHLGALRRADLACVSRSEPPDQGLGDAARRQARREERNWRKQGLTAQSSSRWANAIIRGNDDQYRLSREAQSRHIIGLQAAIAAIQKRLVAPTGDTLTVQERTARKKARLPKGYATQAERFQQLTEMANPASNGETWC